MSPIASNDEQRQVDIARRDLVAEFAGRLPEAEVTAHFDEVLGSFEGAPVRTFVPVLAERQARLRLLGG